MLLFLVLFLLGIVFVVFLAISIVRRPAKRALIQWMDTGGGPEDEPPKTPVPTLPKLLPHPGCSHRVSPGYAMCHACGTVRPNFRCVRKLISNQIGLCTISLGVADVKFKNGDYVWAEYVAPLIDPAWEDEADHSEELEVRYLEWRSQRF